MDGDLASKAPAQRAQFNIDLEELGTFLAAAFIKRLDAFTPPDRITILKACRQRLAAEHDIAENLLSIPSQTQLPQPVAPGVLSDPSVL